MNVNTSKKILCQHLSGGRFSPVSAAVIIEKELPVHINGQHLFTAYITPGMEKEFVVGYLFGQGFIRGALDIESLDITKTGVKVTLRKSVNKSFSPAKASYRIVSGGGRMAYYDTSDLPGITSRMKVPGQVIFRAMNTLFEEASFYRETEGVHAAGLYTPEAGPLCLAEDIGRHNSLDKVIGYALLNKIDCTNVFLVSTGRMASEMVMKICRVGIPLVATKTAVTDFGLEIGKKCGLTIIGFVRDTGTKTHTDMEVRITRKAQMKIYSGAERVVC